MRAVAASGPQRCDVLVVGAGPHGLALCRYLDLSIRSVVVADPDGWLARWQDRLDALGVDMLRSHTTHHPDPDLYGLASFAIGRGRLWIGGWSTPTSEVFADYCRTLVSEHGLDDVLLRDRVTRVRPRLDRSAIEVTTAGGRQYLAARVVLATNPARPLVPTWAARVDAPPGRMLHSEHVDLRGLRLDGAHVLVVGGGLTGCGVALGAVDRGATVSLVSRRPLELRVPDVESNWLSPNRLRDFYADTDWCHRSATVRSARGGGTVTPPVAWRLREEAAAGRVRLLEGCNVGSAVWDGCRWMVGVDGHRQRADVIWLATGSRVSVDAAPLLADVAAEFPIEVVEGIPVLDRYFRWPGTELHVMGGLAALQLGPFARNIAGARMGADRIASLVDPARRGEYLQPVS